MTKLPVAQVLSVDREPGITRLDVLCPYCSAIHHHQWLNAAARFTVNAPCSTGADIRQYHVKAHSLQASNHDDINDNAMHEYENNWIE
ncbi:hypothetical protein [Mycobacterium intracellulare]|uniref:hypothetical protein n=1 Tax=Mycobacterium intracellulare TaxID=1767 RepID=UPI000AB6880E|nr:hypothetical protein [Mycobacterium intracellulare]MEE3805000.1 hypothetical protein [Mycobacterium intracellulare]UQB85577.1 hypothetical protein KN249_15620 [Mycobacterium intracellulare]UQC09179.1 hypothetical protein KN251_10230 [Mycobacterium intracellulare ATCC 13950]